MRISLVIFIFLQIVFLCSIIIKADEPCNSSYNGLIYRFDKLSFVPPISTEMSEDVAEGYKILDSVRQFGNYYEFTAWFKNLQFNDTLKYILKYYYRMMDYDPISLILYCDYNGEYGGSFNLHVSLIQDELQNKILEIPEYVGLNIILNADYIFHIKVKDTTRVYHPSNGIYNRSLIATADIIDIIKGHRLPACVYLNNSNTVKKFAQLSNSEHFIQFEFALDWQYGETDDIVAIPVDRNGKQWVGVTNRLVDSNDIPWIKKDREYIVFLHYVLICTDKQYRYYTLFPFASHSVAYGMYPIVNGIVQDPNNEFGFGTKLNAAEFKAAMRKFIESIVDFRK